MKKFYVWTILTFLLFASGHYGILYIIQEKEVLKIGEDKYLAFLWMVDGAFNNSLYNDTFYVNGKAIDNNMLFQCFYINNKNTCKGENFEEAFNSLFASNITYDDVYSDKVSFKWYEKVNNNYFFTNNHTCSTIRMNRNQKLEIISSEENKKIYKVFFQDNENNRVYDKQFILVKEKDKWKVEKAYYHDACHMDYNIGKG